MSKPQFRTPTEILAATITDLEAHIARQSAELRQLQADNAQLRRQLAAAQEKQFIVRYEPNPAAK